MKLTRRSMVVSGVTAASTLSLKLSNAEPVVNPRESGLPRSSPSEQGVDPTSIRDFLNMIHQRNANLHSVMIAKNDFVIAEGWWAPYAPNLKHTFYSLSKSFTSTAVGMATSEKFFSLEDPVLSFFKEKAPSDASDNLRSMKVKHLLMMGAGHSADSLLGADFSNPSGDWIKSVLEKKVDHIPGTHFVYNNGATFLLSAIVQKTTGKRVHDFLRPRLFEPLGINNTDWEINPAGINPGAFGFRAKTEDIAKFGLLYLHKGDWQGQQILTRDWVEMATSKQINNAGNQNQIQVNNSDWAQGYGFQFWRCRNNCYRGDGAYGQYCVVLPDQNSVIAITAESADLQLTLNAIWTHLLPALSTRFAGSDAIAEQNLTKQLRGLSCPMPVGAPVSRKSMELKKANIAFDTNPVGVRSLKVEFRPKVVVFELEDKTGIHRFEAGLMDWVNGRTTYSTKHLYLAKTVIPGEKDARSACAAAWKDQQTLSVIMRFPETAHYDTFDLTFDSENVKLEFRRSAAILSASKDFRPVISGRIV